MTPRQSVIVDVVADVVANPRSECVIAPKTPNRFGYVQFGLNGKPNILAHRYAYEQAHGPIPDGMQIDHLCHDETCPGGEDCKHRACVNPAHLAPATPRENVLRGNTIVAAFARATHCVNGHPFDDANTYRHSRGRSCRQCRRAAEVRSRTRRNAS